MRKVSFLLVLSMLVLTGCFDKKTRVVEESSSEYLEVSDLIQVDDTGEIINTGDGSTSDSSTIIEIPTLVPIDRPVVLTFAENIDASTVDQFSVYIVDKNFEPVPAELIVVDNQIHIIPNAFLLPDENYTIVITTAVKDIEGSSFDSVLMYTFTTEPLSDTTPPILTSLIPTDGALNVDKTTNVTMTFSENIANNGVTLEVRDSLNALVAGTNAVSANTLNFNPTSDLTESESYTVTLTGNIEDLSGNSYASISTWSFTVAPLVDSTPPNLTSLTPTDGETNVDKAINMTMVFDENIADNGVTLLVEDSLGSQVVGTNSVSANTLNFNPTSDLMSGETYTVTLQGSVEDLSGNVYAGSTSWSFSVADTINPTLTSLTPTDGALNVDKTTNVMMTFAETIANNGVTLQVRDSLNALVAGTNTISANTLNFNPTSDLMSGETYTVTLIGNVEDLSGNVYAGTTTWSFSVADTIDPTLTSLTPTDGEIDVDKAINMTMVFDENIADNGVTLEVLDRLNVSVFGTGTVSANTLNFDPTSDLMSGETYTVTLQGTVLDLSGNVYAGTTSWSFTVADTIVPTLTSLIPTDGETDVDKTTNVMMTFSENIANNGVTLLVEDSLGSPVAGTNTVSGNTLNFDPTSDLMSGETYTVTLQGTVLDLSGNVYAGTTTWNFTIASDVEAPTLDAFIPADGATQVDKNTTIKAIFDENVTNGGKVFEVTDVTLGTEVAGSDGYTGNTLWFIPDNDLIPEHNYSVSIHGPATEDLEGNKYTGQTVWSFTVAPLVDITPPTITGVSPADGTIVADTTPEITMTFDEEIQNVGQTLKLRDMTTGSNVQGTSGDTGNKLWFIPSSALVPGHDYNVTVQGDTEDLAFNVAPTAGMIWSFTVAPFDVSDVVRVGDLVTVFFSDNLDPATVSANDFEIDSGTITFNSFVYTDFLKVVSFTADQTLDGSEIISVSGTITDTEGNFVNDGVPMDYTF